MPKIYAYIGSWGGPRSNHDQGISIARYDMGKGTFHVLNRVLPEINCGGMCLDDEKKILYCVNERRQIAGKPPGGEVYALSINSSSGNLKVLSCEPSYGLLPSYCAVNGDKKYLIITNHSSDDTILETVRTESGSYQLAEKYSESSVVMYQLRPDGTIGKLCDIVKHIPVKKKGNSHVHSVYCSPSGKLFAVCDKGNDTISFYRIDSQKEKLVLCDQMSAAEGSSPRYAAFHPAEPYLYFNNETKTIVNMVRYSANGKMTPICLVSCLADKNMERTGWQSDIKIHPSGKYIYDLLREDSIITVYRIDNALGIPQLIQTIACGSSHGGRGMAISPDGKFLHLAAHPEDSIYTFLIGEDGRLEAVRRVDHIPGPGNIVFFKTDN